MLFLASDTTVRMAEPDAGQRLSAALLRQLEPILPMPAYLRQLIHRSVLRLLDSAMLIEDPLRDFQGLPASVPSMALPDIPHLEELEEVIADIGGGGLASHFLKLMAGMGKTMTWLHGSEDQRRQVEGWSEDGYIAGFFLTDRGGPSMQKDWLSVFDEDEENGHLRVDKIWGISALSCDFAFVAARQAGRLSPALLMVPPHLTIQLKRTPCGLPYLDGTLQLGNISGSLVLPRDCVLQKGGAMGVKQYMSLVRPRFIRALCAHVEWLQSQHRAALSLDHVESLAYISAAAENICRNRQFSRYSEDAVMALKFAINELLLHLVEEKAVYTLMDQRDLLAFTKMEGSSYRCFYEVYSRSKGARHGS